MRVIRTPVSEQGLASLDHLPPSQALVRAWTEPGRFPSVHRKAKRIVHSAMPLVARALDRLAEDAEREPQTPGGQMRADGSAAEEAWRKFREAMEYHSPLPTTKFKDKADRTRAPLPPMTSREQVRNTHAVQPGGDPREELLSPKDPPVTDRITNELALARHVYRGEDLRDPQKVIDVVEELLRSRGLIE